LTYLYSIGLGGGLLTETVYQWNGYSSHSVIARLNIHSLICPMSLPLRHATICVTVTVLKYSIVN